jgi:hypothetical protein
MINTAGRNRVVLDLAKWLFEQNSVEHCSEQLLTHIDNKIFFGNVIKLIIVW